MTEIQLVDIDAQLKKLWDEELGKDRTRASLFNLIIYTSKLIESDYRTVVQTVIAKFPCRVLWIKDGGKDKSYLQTHVSKESVSSNTYCEIIEIDVAGKLAERVPYIVLPHILPDLPIYLVWTDDPTQDEWIFPSLSRLVDKVILDTNFVQNLSRFSLTALALENSFSDLNWIGLRGWRYFLASIFDSHETLSLLKESKEIEITYNAPPHVKKRNQEIKAFYFQAWLASSLKWSFQKVEREKENTKIFYQTNGKTVKVTLTPFDLTEYEKLPSGALLSCDIMSHKNNAQFVIKRHIKAHQLFFQYFDNEKCDLPLCHNLPGIVEGQEIIEEIFYHSEDKHYRNMLQLISQEVE